MGTKAASHKTQTGGPQARRKSSWEENTTRSEEEALNLDGEEDETGMHTEEDNIFKPTNLPHFQTAVSTP